MDPAALPSYLLGLHDTGGEDQLLAALKPGWVTVAARIDRTLPLDFSAQAHSGLGVVVTLLPGAEDAFPAPEAYDSFARACAAAVAHARDARIWVIGAEPNRLGMAPADYARAFALCRGAIKELPGHADDWVVPAAPAPWSTATRYPANPGGDWIRYFQDVLFQLVQQSARPDALALHAHTHGLDPARVSADSRAEGFPTRHGEFRAYRDFLQAVPPVLRALPVLLTSVSPLEWVNENRGWIQAVAAEIDAWNAEPAHQPVQAVCFYRWPDLASRPALLQDLRAALGPEYHTRWPRLAPRPEYQAEWTTPPEFPSVVVQDTTVTGRVAFRNRGARGWRAGAPPVVRLGISWFDRQGAPLRSPELLALPENVLPGMSTVLEEVSSRAPDRAGSYFLHLDLLADGAGWFAALGSPALDLAVTVRPPDHYAQWLEVVAIPPGTLRARAFARGTVRVKNVGAQTWLRGGAGAVRLGYHWYGDQGIEVPLPAAPAWAALKRDTPPGQVAQFDNVVVQAPAAPGEYELAWDLVQADAEWFGTGGSPIHAVRVQVNEPIPDFAARWIRLPQVPQGHLEPNETVRVELAAENVGTQAWRGDAPAPVTLDWEWRDAAGRRVEIAREDEPAPVVSEFVPPGKRATLSNVRVRAPVRQGRYSLAFRLRSGSVPFSRDVLAEPAFAESPLGRGLVELTVETAAPDFAAQWDETPAPARIVAGETVPVRVRATNRGGQLWAAAGPTRVGLGYAWYDEGGAPVMPGAAPQFPLPHDILPRESLDLSALSLRAPGLPGEYTLEWNLYRADAGAFPPGPAGLPSARVSVRPAPHDWMARFLAHDTPPHLPARARVAVALRIQNIGEQAWADRVTVGYQWLDAEGTGVQVPGAQATRLPQGIAPEAEVTLVAQLLTPSFPGLYELRWDLLLDGSEWFADHAGQPLAAWESITAAEEPVTGWRAEANPHGAEAARALDGNTATDWSSVAPQAAGMWFRVDFFRPRMVDGLVFRSPGQGHPHAFAVRVTADGRAWPTVLAVESGSGADVLVTFAPQRVLAAQIDLTAASPDSGPWQIADVAMHPAIPWVATASVNDAWAARVLEEGAAQFWSTEVPQQPDMWFQVDLAVPQMVSGLELIAPQNEHPRGYAVSVWNETAASWQVVSQARDNQAPVRVGFAPVETRYLQIQLTQPADRPWAIRSLKVARALTGWVGPAPYSRISRSATKQLGTG